MYEPRSGCVERDEAQVLVQGDQVGVCAFDPADRAVMGKRSREWTAIAPTEEAVVKEMGRWPARDRGRQDTEVERGPACSADLWCA